MQQADSSEWWVNWGFRIITSMIISILIVGGTYAWNGLTASSWDSLLLSKWNELVARTEPVMAQYYMSTSQACPNGPTGCILNFNTKEYDTNNAVTTGSAWKFTVPIAGTYRVTTTVSTVPINWWNASNSLWLWLNKNGLWVKSMEGQYEVTTVSTVGRLNGTCVVQAAVGDTLAIAYVPWTPGSVGISLAANSSDTWVAIERIGN